MYCALADLEKQMPLEKLIALTDGDGAPDTANIDRAIADAGAEIDAWAASQYRTPFDPAPPVIQKIAVDIALYNLFSRKGFDLSETSGDYNIYLRYKAALDFLKALAAGKAKVDAGGEGGGPGLSAAAAIKNEPRIFTRSKLKGY
jgi:phage gp36-like protein